MQRDEFQHYQMQEAIQKQQLDNQTTTYAPQLQEQIAQSQAVLVTQTNPNKVIKDIELSLENKERNVDGTIVVLGPPLMNKEGLNRMRFIMRGVINQNTILSHLEEDQIGRIVTRLADDLTDDLTLNWKEYGIKDKMMLDHIINSIIFPAYMALMRAYGQNEKNWLKGITVETISGGRSVLPNQKGGFWEKFKL